MTPETVTEARAAWLTEVSRIVSAGHYEVPDDSTLPDLGLFLEYEDPDGRDSLILETAEIVGDTYENMYLMMDFHGLLCASETEWLEAAMDPLNPDY